MSNMPKRCLSKREDYPVLVVYFLVFFTLLVLTVLTPMVSDDYPYSFSWVDWTRLRSVSQIIPSMAVHRVQHNGRVFAHGLVQLFLLWPRAIYCILNACSGLLLCICTRRLIALPRQRDVAVILLFGAFFICCFTTAFGEDYLWLYGSLNYSWCITFSLLFVLPFFLDYLEIPVKTGRLQIILHLLLAFWAGAYSESTSLVFLCLAGLLWLLQWKKNGKPDSVRLLWLIGGILGYVFLMSAPSTSDLAGSFTFAVLGYNFRTVFAMAQSDLVWPYLIFAVLLSLAVFFRADRKTIWLSALVFSGGLACLASYLFAAYLEPRHLCSPVFFTMLACTLLLSALCQCGREVYSRVGIACMAVLFLLQFPVGVLDVAVSWHKQQIRLQQIQEALDAGETTVTLENYYPYTGYAVRFIMNTKDPSYGPNINMADYYGLEAVYGVDPPESEN